MPYSSSCWTGEYFGSDEFGAYLSAELADYSTGRDLATLGDLDDDGEARAM